MMADKGKKQKVEEKGEEQIDGELVLSIEKLQELQDQLEKINEKASDEVLEVEQKYNKVRKPVYDKRKEIIGSIPEFWLTAFLSHPALSQLLTDEDQKIFKYLESLEVDESKDVKLGYTISFNFNSNPYFKDSKLSKTFNFFDEGIKVTSTPIKWKEGMDISNGSSNERKGNKRPLDEESFFSWFEESEDMDEMNDQIAEIIKEDLWPNPLSYFNNDGEEEDFKDEDDEEDTEDDNDEVDGDDDDDDKE